MLSDDDTAHVYAHVVTALENILVHASCIMGQQEDELLIAIYQLRSAEKILEPK